MWPVDVEKTGRCNLVHAGGIVRVTSESRSTFVVTHIVMKSETTVATSAMRVLSFARERITSA